VGAGGGVFGEEGWSWQGEAGFLGREERRGFFLVEHAVSTDQLILAIIINPIKAIICDGFYQSPLTLKLFLPLPSVLPPQSSSNVMLHWRVLIIVCILVQYL
jgi:hypothetical protein